MSGGDNWAPGDLALCVARTARYSEPCDPRPGGIYTVRSVELLPDIDTRNLGIGLDFEGLHPLCGHAYDASRFRRIPPLTDEERRRELADLPVPEGVAA